MSHLPERAATRYTARLAARFCFFGLAIAVTSSACRPDDAPTVAPTSDAIVDEDDDEAAQAGLEPTAPEPEVDPPLEDGFVVTLASKCRDTWNGMLVAGGEHEGEARPRASGWEPGGFEVRHASNRELVMRRGDALLLTNPSGGIMALRFDNLRTGWGALVEVTRECSGVNQTVVRAASR